MIWCKRGRVIWSLAVLAFALGSSAGCRSTSRWNPSTWFAGREPDASMIAGRSGAPELPTSPSLNHTPTALANNYGATGGGPSTTAQSGSSVAASGTGATTAATQKNTSAPFGSNPHGSSPNNGSPYGSLPGSSVPPSGGLAARANGFQPGTQPSTQPNNGYQTGPYGMSPSATGTSSPIPTVPASTSSVVAAPNVNSKSTPTTYPSPYGGSYGYSTPQSASGSSAAIATASGTSVGSPTTTAGSVASEKVPDYPSLPAMPVSATLGSSAGTSVPTNQTTQYGYSTAPATNTTTSSGPPAFPQLGPGIPTVNNQGTVVSSPANSTLPAPSAYQSAPPAGSYSPGTTGRSTNYNFGAGSSQNSTQPATSSVPSSSSSSNSGWVR